MAAQLTGKPSRKLPKYDDSAAKDVYNELVKLYSDGSSYGGLSQLAHASQVALHAVRAGCDDATIVAGLLHDIGWKLAGAAPFKIDAAASNAGTEEAVPKKPKHGQESKMSNACYGEGRESIAGKLGILSTCAAEGASAEQQRAQHDTIGATFLRMRGFCEKVPHLIEGHVLAKRYLCFKEKDYYSKLSPGSKRTLVFQGGPMTKDEAAIFESDPLFEQSKQMRRWDEESKAVGLKVPDFRSYKTRILHCISESPKSAQQTLKTCSYLRHGNTIIGLRGAET